MCACYAGCPECPSEVVCVEDARRELFESLERGAGHPGFLALLDDLRALHLLKSGGYGTGADPFGNFTAVATLTEQPRYLYAAHRSIEKLTRVLSLHAQGRADELSEEFMDVAGLMLCAAAMLTEDSSPLLADRVPLRGESQS
jgi:hypothetical protein